MRNPSSSNEPTGGALPGKRLEIHRGTLCHFDADTKYTLTPAGAKRNPALAGQSLSVVSIDAPGDPYTHRDPPDGAIFVTDSRGAMFLITHAVGSLAPLWGPTHGKLEDIDFFGEDDRPTTPLRTSVSRRMRELLAQADAEHDALPRDANGFVIDPEFDWYDNDDGDNPNPRPDFDWLDQN